MLPPAGGILADFNKYRYKSQKLGRDEIKTIRGLGYRIG